MIPIYRYPSPRSTGFSLIEIMVGMVIGMIGIIVMMQVFAVSEGYKRTTTGGDDAQSNGAIALFGLQRDMRQGGYGSSAFSLIGCNVLLRAGVTLNAMAPVTINHASIPAGDANTDTVLVAYGSANGSPEGDNINITPPDTKTYPVPTPTSFTVGDQIIVEPAARPSPCALTLEPIVSKSGANLVVATGTASATIGSTIYNLGPAPRVVAYAIRSGNLTVCDYTVNDCSSVASVGDSTIWVPSANNIVSMRAQYGRDTSVPMDAIVDLYDRTTPVSSATTFACDWARISAVRIALVARSGQYDKKIVSTSAPAWAGTTAGNPSGSESNPIDLSKNPDGTANPNWQYYRYKLFQTVVPIRNVTWKGVQKGC